jgi:hypothetical protein
LSAVGCRDRSRVDPWAAWGAPLLLLGLAAGPVRASDATWHLEAGLGVAHSLGSRLTIEQDSLPRIEIDADWDSRSLDAPLYYGWRVARWGGERAWALRFIHHKLYLANPTADVERFAVSHGYNLLTAERGWDLGAAWLWAGLGVVVAHPESTVRGRTRREDQGGPLGGGYFVTGPALSLALARRLPLGGRFGLVVEGRAAACRARVPVAGGEASVPTASLHAALGLDVGF